MYGENIIDHYFAALVHKQLWIVFMLCICPFVYSCTHGAMQLTIQKTTRGRGRHYSFKIWKLEDFTDEFGILT